MPPRLPGTEWDTYLPDGSMKLEMRERPVTRFVTKTYRGSCRVTPGLRVQRGYSDVCLPFIQDAFIGFRICQSVQ